MLIVNTVSAQEFDRQSNIITDDNFTLTFGNSGKLKQMYLNGELDEMLNNTISHIKEVLRMKTVFYQSQR